MKKIIFIFCFSILTFLSKAGDIDTNYVQKFKNIFALKLFLNNSGFNYSILPRNNANFTSQQLKDAQLIFSPYILPTAGISVNVKGIGITYIFKFANDFLDTLGKAKSDFKQIQINMYGNKFGLEMFYQDYRRFYYYYKGDEKLSKNYNSDMRAYQWGANGVFIFNGAKFSYNAAFNQTMLQKKSAGSGMMIISLKYNEIKGNNFIPDSVKQFYKRFDGLERNRNYAVLFQGGYGFNITKNDFYFSGALLGGFGGQFQTYKYSLGTMVNFALPLVARVKGGLGYNGKIFFTGIYANADVMRTNIKDIRTTQTIYSYGFYFGIRAIKYTKTKGQLKQEEAHNKWVKKEAAKKVKEEKKKQKQQKSKK